MATPPEASLYDEEGTSTDGLRDSDRADPDAAAQGPEAPALPRVDIFLAGEEAGAHPVPGSGPGAKVGQQQPCPRGLPLSLLLQYLGTSVCAAAQGVVTLTETSCVTALELAATACHADTDSGKAARQANDRWPSQPWPRPSAVEPDV